MSDSASEFAPRQKRSSRIRSRVERQASLRRTVSPSQSPRRGRSSFRSPIRWPVSSRKEGSAFSPRRRRNSSHRSPVRRSVPSPERRSRVASPRARTMTSLLSPPRLRLPFRRSRSHGDASPSHQRGSEDDEKGQEVPLIRRGWELITSSLHESAFLRCDDTRKHVFLPFDEPYDRHKSERPASAVMQGVLKSASEAVECRTLTNNLVDPQSLTFTPLKHYKPFPDPFAVKQCSLPDLPSSQPASFTLPAKQFGMVENAARTAITISAYTQLLTETMQSIIANRGKPEDAAVILDMLNRAAVDNMAVNAGLIMNCSLLRRDAALVSTRFSAHTKDQLRHLPFSSHSVFGDEAEEVLKARRQDFFEALRETNLFRGQRERAAPKPKTNSRGDQGKGAYGQGRSQSSSSHSFQARTSYRGSRRGSRRGHALPSATVTSSAATASASK